ncbi:hypothetical protein Bpfe_019269 [Biomphalaria pfeifferi]|uniref:Uncharacterized protein n=1 Tax=Biomphalaria pfeifferi TaxID=112525 RepID=A0AAD8BCA8_BIOPF|nr:hypothetical protein Bpfe_019269 [Biomphalaria pfeifferi]
MKVSGGENYHLYAHLCPARNTMGSGKRNLEHCVSRPSRSSKCRGCHLQGLSTSFMALVKTFEGGRGRHSDK